MLTIRLATPLGAFELSIGTTEPEPELDYAGATIVALDEDPELAAAITDRLLVEYGAGFSQ